MRFITVALALCHHCLCAQWQLVANGDQLPSAAFDGCVRPDGGIAITTNTYAPNGMLDQAFVVQLFTTGEPDDSVSVHWPGELAKGLHIYNRNDGVGYYVTGYFSDPANVDYENQCYVAEVADSQVQLYRHGARWHGGLDGLGFVDADGSLVYGRYAFQDFGVADFKFIATRHCPAVGACDSGLVLEQLGIGRFHASARLNDTTIMGVMPMTNPMCSFWSNALILLSNDIEPIDCKPIFPVDTGSWGSASNFDDNLSLLVLESGNILLCGMYMDDLPSDVRHPVAIQRADPYQGALARRLLYNSTNDLITMRPGIMRGMSAFDESTFAFAYNDCAWSGGPWPSFTETSNIHVLKMDTALNILGAYVFNGDAINRYHFLSSVVASPDGAVYVMGSVYDHDADDPMPKSWVARVGPEQFVSVPDATQAGFAVFPNPGTEGFNLRMANPIGGAVARLHDAQGRLLREHPLSDAQTWIDADALPGGLYLVQVTARDGSRFSARWVKE